MGEPLLEARAPRKRFGGHVVLDSVDLTVDRGEVHAIVGEDGAGKSTLIKILGGVHKADGGAVLLEGGELTLGSPQAAPDKGIVVIHQELSLAPHLTTGREHPPRPLPPFRLGLIDRRAIREQTRALLDRLSIDIDAARPVHQLSIAQQQMIEIAKAISVEAKVLVLDEPTAVLDAQPGRHAVRPHRPAEGAGHRHRLHLASLPGDLPDHRPRHRVAGRHPHRRQQRGQDRPGLAGGEDDRPAIRRAPLHARVRIGRARTRRPQFARRVRRGVALRPRRGDRRARRPRRRGADGGGTGGVRRSAYLRRRNPPVRQACADQGAARRGRQGNRLRQRGPQGVWPSPKPPGVGARYDRQSRAVRLLRCPQHAQGEGLRARSDRRARHPPRIHAGGDPDAERRQPAEGPHRSALAGQPRILIFDEPTRGVNVGAKREIYRLIEDLAAGGVAILLISSEMDEILRLSDRVVVMRQGRVAVDLPRSAANEESIMRAATPG